MAGKASFTELVTGETGSCGRKCGLALVFDTMPPDLAAEVKAAMGNDALSGAAISRSLAKVGYPIKEGSVRRCRQVCNCWKTS